MTHEDLKKQYEADAQWHPRPWELWECRPGEVLSFITCGTRPNWFEKVEYRRKPDAPGRNCAMCKFSTTNYYFSCCLDLSRDPFSLKSMTHPDWCPLAQKEETTDTLRNPQHKPWCACNTKGLRMCDCGLVSKELDQPEEDKHAELIKAAEDALEWLSGLQGVIVTRGDEKIEALRKAVDAAKQK